MKKKILVDLDVITVATWKKSDTRTEEAINFLERVKNNEFEVYIPYTLIELLAAWKNKELSEQILRFYSVYAKDIITANSILEVSERAGIDFTKVAKQIVASGIKEEDATLILVTSLFEMGLKKSMLHCQTRSRPFKFLYIFEELFSHTSLHFISQFYRINVRWDKPLYSSILKRLCHIGHNNYLISRDLNVFLSLGRLSHL